MVTKHFCVEESNPDPENHLIAVCGEVIDDFDDFDLWETWAPDFERDENKCCACAQHPLYQMKLLAGLEEEELLHCEEPEWYFDERFGDVVYGVPPRFDIDDLAGHR